MDSEFLPFEISSSSDPVWPPLACGHTKSRCVYPGYRARKETNQQLPQNALTLLVKTKTPPLTVKSGSRPLPGGRPGSRPPLQARWTAARRARAPSGALRWRRALSRPTNHPAPVSPGPAGPRPRTHQDIGPLTAPTRLTHVDALVRWRASPCARLSRRRPVCRRRRRGRVREHRRTDRGSPPLDGGRPRYRASVCGVDHALMSGGPMLGIEQVRTSGFRTAGLPERHGDRAVRIPLVGPLMGV